MEEAYIGDIGEMGRDCIKRFKRSHVPYPNSVVSGARGNLISAGKNEDVMTGISNEKLTHSVRKQLNRLLGRGRREP